MKRNIYNLAHKAMMEMSHAITKIVSTAYPKSPLYNARNEGERNSLTLNYHSTANLSIIYDEEVGYGWVDNTACSAGLGYTYRDRAKGDKFYEHKRNAIASLHQHRNSAYGNLTEAEQRVFYDWFLRRSPYAKCISTKSVDYAMKFGILIDGNFPANLVVGATIAQRVLWEYTPIVRSMQCLVKLGMNESIAFMIAHTYVVDGGGLIVSRHAKDGHTAIDGGCISDAVLINFYKGKMPNKLPNYSEHKNYDKIHMLWGALVGEYKSYKALFPIMCSAVFPAEGEAAAVAEVGIPNPFAASMVMAVNNNNELTINHLKSMVLYTNKLIGVGNE